MKGPFSWIHEGNVDIIAVIMFPADNDGGIAKVMSDFYDRIEATVTSKQSHRTNEETGIINNDSVESVESKKTVAIRNGFEDDDRVLIMDLLIQLNDVRAAVPLFAKELSYVNNALIRPIVAYLNSRKNFIPINCRVIKRVDEFDGSWTMFDSGLMDDLSAEVIMAMYKRASISLTGIQTYKAFAQDVMDDQARLRRFRKVGLWSLQLAIQALFMGFSGNIAS